MRKENSLDIVHECNWVTVLAGSRVIADLGEWDEKTDEFNSDIWECIVQDDYLMSPKEELTILLTKSLNSVPVE